MCDRDLNAARNIEQEALYLVNRGRSGFTDSLNGRGREGSGRRETDGETGPDEAPKMAEERQPSRLAVV